MVPLFQRMSLGYTGDKGLQSESADQLTKTAPDYLRSPLSINCTPLNFKNTCVKRRMLKIKLERYMDSIIHRKHTYGSFDLGINVPSSLMRSLMLNLRLRSTRIYQIKYTVFIQSFNV